MLEKSIYTYRILLHVHVHVVTSTDFTISFFSFLTFHGESRIPFFFADLFPNRKRKLLRVERFIRSFDERNMRETRIFRPTEVAIIRTFVHA